jgi:rRNA-processing protein FCF1
VLKGIHEVIIPSVIIAEVCAIISRLTNSEEEGIKAAEEIQRYCVVVYESKPVFEELLPLIARVKGSGIDSILAAVAMKEGSLLITNDRKLHNLLKDSSHGINLKLLADMSVNDASSMGTT